VEEKRGKTGYLARNSERGAVEGEGGCLQQRIKIKKKPEKKGLAIFLGNEKEEEVDIKIRPFAQNGGVKRQ